MHFTSHTGYNLSFFANFGLAAPWFLAKTTTWVCFNSCKFKNGGNIQIIAGETSKMHLLQIFLFWTFNFDDSPFLSQLT